MLHSVKNLCSLLIIAMPLVVAACGDGDGFVDENVDTITISFDGGEPITYRETASTAIPYDPWISRMNTFGSTMVVMQSDFSEATRQFNQNVVILISEDTVGDYPTGIAQVSYYDNGKGYGISLLDPETGGTVSITAIDDFMLQGVFDMTLTDGNEVATFLHVAGTFETYRQPSM